MPAPRIDVWADPICPFCYVATERAAWLRDRFGADVRWHPFELHPEYPPEGIPREVLRRRLPGADEHTRRLFEANGLPSAGLPEWIPNSGKALRVALAAEGVLPRFVDAFWARGRDIGDDAVIVEEATAAGLDEDVVREILATDAHGDALRAETEAVLEHGATGVPAWVVDERALIPGAQPHDVFERVLERLGHA